MTAKPLEGVLVVTLEQAVAAPWCSSRLADAGARVIKIERPEGDCARGDDGAVNGEASSFVWVNRGKESLVLDLRHAADRAQLAGLVATADVFLQDLPPGSAARLGFGSELLRARHPRLVTCDISAYGDSGPLAQLKAGELLVQAESGLLALGGAPGEAGGIGVAICGIAAGMNALIAIQQALLQRACTGLGSAVKVSLFDAAADLMAVPYLRARYGAGTSADAGLRHGGSAPEGAFTCSDGRELVLSIADERDWACFCAIVLGRASLADDARFRSNALRARHRGELHRLIQQVFSQLTHAEAMDRLTEAQTAFGTIHSVHDLIGHPQLRTWPMTVQGRTVQVPAPPSITPWDTSAFASAPALGEHLPLPGPQPALA